MRHGGLSKAMLSASETARIWGDSISGRLNSARLLSDATLAAVHEDLSDGCPLAVWPYGNATSINPLIVTLGPSPGGSPDRGVADPAGKPLALPTAGVRHPHTTYEDRKGFWRKIRFRSLDLDPQSDQLAHMLGEISTAEHEAGRGMLTVVVVHKHGDQMPGPGFFRLAGSLGHGTKDREAFWIGELEKVYAAWCAGREADV